MVGLRQFDEFIAIDWSGAKSPIETPSIAIAKCAIGNGAPTLITGPWSRTKAVHYIESQLNTGKRTLVGIDCNFGFAETFGKTAFGNDYTHHDMWAAVDTTNHQNPNFFAGGFWEHPQHGPYFWTSGKMPDDFQMPKRLSEQACINSGLGTPESPFKLIGAKQVGKGGMAGMRVAHYLKKKHRPAVAIWPFDTIDTCNQASIVISEIYPRIFIRQAAMGNAKIRTTDDINAVLSGLGSAAVQKQSITDHDADAIIASAGIRFMAGQQSTVPERLSIPPQTIRDICRREGWIFGVEFPA